MGGRRADWQEINRMVLAALDIRAEYAALGVRIAGHEPNHGGWLSCHAHGRDDQNPSAGINVGADAAARGRYRDFGGAGDSLSLFDFAARAGRFADWKEARKHYAEQANIKLPSTDKEPKHPAESLEFQPWNDQLAGLWCLRKKGIDLAALRRAGCRLAKWPKKSASPYYCIATPIFGASLLDDDPCGWVLWNQSGQPLPLFQGKGRPSKPVKMLTTGGSASGWIGQSGLASIMEAETVWLTEGPSDLLAIDSIMPDELRGKHVVLANSGGSTENPRAEFLAILAGKKVHVLRDADEPGELGAAKWCAAVAKVAGQVKHVRLPFAVEKDHGKDVRDWLLAENDWHGLVALAEAAPLWNAGAVVASVAAAPASPPPAAKVETAAPWESSETTSEPEAANGNPPDTRDDADRLFHERQIMRLLRLDVLGELESNGQVKVFSEYHRKTAVISDVARLSYPALLKICGPPAKEHVQENTGDTPAPGVHGMKDVREAISLLAGYERITEQSLYGPGCWLGSEYGDARQESILIAGAGEVAIWNGSGQLSRVTSPRAAGRVFDISNTNPWFRFDQLRELVEGCNHASAIETIRETETLFARWRWEHPDASPAVITGLILAAWIQTLWDWRPQVAITGKSNAGKTTLFNCLRDIFGKLSAKSGDQSVAGLRQKIQSSALIVLCDEFEQNQHRQEILEMMRSSGRGDSVWRGTPSQRGHEYTLRHIIWVAAVEVGLQREADRNRFIRLELKRAEKSDRNKLELPSGAELAALGMRLLAVAVRFSREALAMAAELKRVHVDGVHERVIESYAVPCSIISAACGMPLEKATGLLAAMVEPLKAEATPESDEADLIHTILGALVDLGRGEKSTVGKLLENYGIDARDALEKCGLSVVEGLAAGSTNHHELEREGADYLFVAQKLVSERLLKFSKWENQSIEQILRRIDGAFPSRRRVAGQRPSGTCIPMTHIVAEFVMEKDEAEKYLADQERIRLQRVSDNQRSTVRQLSG